MGDRINNLFFPIILAGFLLAGMAFALGPMGRRPAGVLRQAAG